MTQQPPLKGLTALVVDDSPPLQLIVKRLLELAGAARVDTANGGDQAEPLVVATDYDLVITDIQMPVQDGHAVIRRLRAAGCVSPAIAITADPSPSEKRRCVESGFAACLGKPFNRDELVATVQKVLTSPAAVPHADVFTRPDAESPAFG